MRKEEFIKKFEEGIKDQDNEMVVVEVQIKDNKGTEKIINTREDFQSKFNYYADNYYENTETRRLEHKKTPGVYIVGLEFGIDIIDGTLLMLGKQNELDDAIGCTATDKVTGFTGIITAYCVYLSQASRFCIEPTANNGELAKEQWFNMERVIIDASVPKVEI